MSRGRWAIALACAAGLLPALTHLYTAEARPSEPQAAPGTPGAIVELARKIAGPSAEAPAAPAGVAPPPRAASVAIAQALRTAPAADAGFRIFQEAERWYAWADALGLWRGGAVGVLTDDQEKMLGAAAMAILELASAGGEMLDRAIEDIDRQPALNRPPEADDRLSEALHAREVILPLRAGRAAAALCGLPRGRSMPRESHALLRSAVELVRGVSAVSPWAQLERDLFLGHAAVIAGQFEAGAAALASARQTAASPDLPEDYSRLAEIEAIAHEAMATAGGDGAVAMKLLQASVSQSRRLAPAARTLEQALLIADAHLRLSRSAKADERRSNDALTSVALARYAEAMRVDDPRWRPTALRMEVLKHLAERLPARRSYSGLHPVAALAAAHALAREESGRERAVEILDELLSRSGVSAGLLGRDAAFERAAALAGIRSEPALERAVHELQAFAEGHAQDERAGIALSMACAAGDRLVRLTAETGADDSVTAQRLELALEAMRAAHAAKLDVPGQDAWRLALARMLVWRIESGLVRREQAEQTAREVESVCGAVSDEEDRVLCAIERASAWSAALGALEESRIAEAATRVLGAVEDAEAEAGPAPRAVDVALKLAMCRARALLALGQSREAVDTMERARSHPGWSAAPDSVRAPALRQLLLAQLEAAESIEQILDTAAELDSADVGGAAAAARGPAERAWKSIEARVRGFPADEAGRGTVGAHEATALLLARRLAEDADDEARAVAAAARHAWSLLLAGRASEAQEEFAALAQRAPKAGDLRRGLGEARLASGDDQGAFAAFRELVAMGDASESPDVWRAWTRMMEILARNNEGGRRSAEIRREIARLRTLQSALEQPECLSRLRDVELALERGP